MAKVLGSIGAILGLIVALPVGVKMGIMRDWERSRAEKKRESQPARPVFTPSRPFPETRFRQIPNNAAPDNGTHPQNAVPAWRQQKGETSLPRDDQFESHRKVEDFRAPRSARPLPRDD